MIASSATVLANLAYLIGAVVLAVVVGLLVWLRHRRPKSVDANMASFRRGLSALAPDAEGGITSLRQAEAARIRPVPAPTHVRVEPRGRRARSAGKAGDTEYAEYPEQAGDAEDTEEADDLAYGTAEDVMGGGQPG